MKQILLNPGPANTSDNVKKALIVDDICPREKSFGEVMKSIQNDITNFLSDTPDDYETVLFSSSGTGAVEAMLTAVYDKDDETLVIINGEYGWRATEILEAYNLKWNFLSFAAELNFEKIDLYLKSNPQTQRVFVVHLETSSGVLNDIKTLGKICQKHSIEFLIDAMSSAFAYPIKMEECGIHYLACSSNKNLQAMPGVSMVVTNKKMLESVNSVSYYFDLKAQAESMRGTGQMRFTPPVQLLYAMQEAINELKDETIELRLKRYMRLSDMISVRMQHLGFERYLPEEISGHIITSFVCPEGFDFDDYHDFLYDKGVTVYPGKVRGTSTFRIANIGHLSVEDIQKFLKLTYVYGDN